MANHPNMGGNVLYLCLIACIKRLAGSLDEPQLIRKVHFESVHVDILLPENPSATSVSDVNAIVAFQRQVLTNFPGSIHGVSAWV